MDDETRLGLIASSILDGTPVDWPTEESASGPDEVVVVQQLRVLAEIAALHRGESALSQGSTTTAVNETQAPARWGHLRLREQGRPAPNLETAGTFAQLGELDAAFEVLESMISARRVMIVHMDSEPRLDPLRSDGRFDQFARRVGLR